MTAGPLFRLDRKQRLEVARRWAGATVDITLGRDPRPGTWDVYRDVKIMAAAVMLTGTVADHIIIRRADGGTWTLDRGSFARQPGSVQTDTLGISLADVREIRLSTS